ncbi:MAG TPA: ankyrin repeat domain-containing protein [Legionella sp.]|nr:ankyrin repeat domain-containing protein [Legionella sp.]
MPEKTSEIQEQNSNKDYRALLIELGVAEHLLQSKELDFGLLYQRLSFVMGKQHFGAPLLVTENWQIEVLGGLKYNDNYLKDDSTLRDNRDASPTHYAAWSGNPAKLEWIKNNAPKALNQKDKYGNSLYHYAARSGNPAALEWIKNNAPKALNQKNNEGSIPIHHAALSGNPAALEWIKNNVPKALNQKNDGDSTPIHYAAWSGNLEALEWVKNNAPKALNQWDRFDLTPIHYAALSGSPQALNYALALQNNPAILVLSYNLRTQIIKKINATLIQALKTNYTLTSIYPIAVLNMSEDDELSVNKSLERNRSIKKATVRFIAFCQGIKQQDSKASLLPADLEMHRLILEQMLPEGVDVNRVFKEVMQNDITVRQMARKEKALALIDREIERLEPSNKEHNTLLGVSINSVHKNSDAKINALKNLKEVVEQGDENMALAIQDWEKNHAQTLSEHRNFAKRVFSQGPTRSQSIIKGIKEIYGIKDNNDALDEGQKPSM